MFQYQNQFVILTLVRFDSLPTKRCHSNRHLKIKGDQIWLKINLKKMLLFGAERYIQFSGWLLEEKIVVVNRLYETTIF